MALPENVLFHKLKGARGWSSFFTQNVDVAKVVEITYRKRLFKIFDTECDYTMCIKYNQLKKHTDLAPTFTGGSGGFGVTVVDTVKMTQLMTVRYATKEDILEEFNSINQKREKLKAFHDEHYKKLREQFPDQE